MRNDDMRNQTKTSKDMHNSSSKGRDMGSKGMGSKESKPQQGHLGSQGKFGSKEFKEGSWQQDSKGSNPSSPRR
ncbi:MAG: hypothetical protein LCH30_06885 [Proteobacteria bacterium]|nr:hypothetical protein [Pseudomonadota bacterium]